MTINPPNHSPSNQFLPSEVNLNSVQNTIQNTPTNEESTLRRHPDSQETSESDDCSAIFTSCIRWFIYIISLGLCDFFPKKITEQGNEEQNVILQHNQDQIVPEVEEQLEEIFRSTRKTQKLFLIDEYKVGIIFNPQSEYIYIGSLSLKMPVILVSDRDLPEEVIERITTKIPEGYKFSKFTNSQINGRPVLECFGFE